MCALGISIPVGSHLDDSQARRTANRAEDVFSAAGRQAGDAFSRNVNQGIGRVDTAGARVKAEQLQRAYDKAADAAGKLRAEEAKLDAVQASGTATRAQLITHTERVERARRAEARAVREATSAYRDAESASRLAMTAGEGIASAAAQAGQSMTAMGGAAANAAGSVTKLSSVAGAAGIALLGVAAFAAVEGVVALGSSVAELSGLVGLLPGVAVAGAAAFGTMKVATLGFSDSLDAVGKSLQDFHDPKKFADDQKAFAESIQSLSPNAQQAALALNAMVPAFDQLKNATQDALFSGIGQELNKLASTYLPSIQQTMVSLSGSFNSMFKGVANELMTPETQKAIQSTLASIQQAFQNLAPAMGPVTKAFAEIANVSSSFLPGLAAALSSAAQHFSAFIDEASKSGQLKQWIQDGVDALKEFGKLGPDLKQLFLDFKANGKTAVGDVVSVMHGMLTVIDKIVAGYDGMSHAVKAMANIGTMAFNGLGQAVDMALQPLRGLISIANKFNPIMDVPQIPRFTPLAAASADAGLNPFSNRVQGQAAAPPGVGTASASDIPGMALATGQQAWPTVPAYPSGGYAVPGMPDDGKKQKPPTVPLGNNDPMSLLQGFPATAELYGAAGTVLDNQQKVAQLKSDLNTLEKANVRDEDAIIAKRNELARAAREEHESELRLNEAKQQAVQKTLKGMQSTAGDLQQLGAQIDKDFGISKGLGGIVENAVKALGNILAAPFLQALGFVAKANPNEGSGLIGIAAANGMFGPQYTPGVIGAERAMQRGGGFMFPGGGPVAGFPAMPGESAVAFAHRTMMPYWQSQGFQVGDHAADKYGEHQNGAIDIMVPSIAAGQQVLAQVLRDPNVYGAIFNNQTYGYGHGPTPQDYTAGHTGDPNTDHTNHVHAWYKPGGTDNIVPGAADASGSLNSLASAAQSATTALTGWDAVAAKESGGNWQNADTGQNGHYGGLQFSPSTWNAFGGQQFAPMPNQASREQQIEVADRTAFTGYNGQAPQGLGAWETIANGQVPGINVNTPASAFGLPGGGMYPGMGMGQGLPTGLPGGSIFPAGYGPGGGVGAPGLGAAAGFAPMQPGLGAAAGLTPGLPGLGAAAGLGVPAAGPGMAYPSHGGNSGNLLGGIPMDAIMAATSGLDMLAPGTSAAAKIGIQVANRTIGYAAQNAGILASGIGEFFSVGDNPKGSIGAGWLGKLAGGFAGAGAALPNIAGQKAPQQQGNQQQQAGTNINNQINVQSREGASGQEHGEQIAAETSRVYAPAGRQ